MCHPDEISLTSIFFPNYGLLLLDLSFDNSNLGWLGLSSPAQRKRKVRIFTVTQRKQSNEDRKVRMVTVTHNSHPWFRIVFFLFLYVLASEQGSYLRTEQNSAFCLVISMGVQIIWQKYLKWYLNIEKDTGFKNSSTSCRDIKSSSAHPIPQPSWSLLVTWSEYLCGMADVNCCGVGKPVARNSSVGPCSFLHLSASVCCSQAPCRIPPPPPTPAFFHSVHAWTLRAMDVTRLVMMTRFKTFRLPLFPT